MADIRNFVADTMRMLQEGKPDPSLRVRLNPGDDRMDSLEVTASHSTYRGLPAIKHTFRLNGERISQRAAELLLRAFPLDGDA